MTSEDRCSACGAPYVRINIIAGGHELTMRSCSACDRRSWHSGGEPVDLEVVLADLSEA